VRAAYSDRKETIGYDELHFVTAAGSEYVLIRKREPDLASPLSALPHETTTDAWTIHDRRDRIVVEQKNTSTPGRVVAEASREGYAFGVPTAEEAITVYRGKNP
jgi:hypothetical protein